MIVHIRIFEHCDVPDLQETTLRICNIIIPVVDDSLWDVHSVCSRDIEGYPNWSLLFAGLKNTNGGHNEAGSKENMFSVF
jgi:hypothetical protein